MTTASRLFVLGAADPEMAAIEEMLTKVGERFAYAAVYSLKGVARVHPGNAYKAEGILPVQPGRPGLLGGEHVTLGEFNAFPIADEVVLVECSFHATHPYQLGRVNEYSDPQAGGPIYCPSSGLEELTRTFLVSRIDHHRHGDPGYGKPPEEFLPASSIGQVVRRLHGGATTGVFYNGGTTGWRLENDVGYPEWGIQPGIVLAAAADHCLEAAYRGRCPGVDPDALMAWRAEIRAAHQRRPVEDVIADVEAARRMVRAAVQNFLPCPACGERGDYCTCLAGPGGGGQGPDLEYADLRGCAVPELPEAACREGIPYLATVRDPDGREKIVLGAASPDLVRRFLAGKVVPGLTGMYGDPARGFAGGYC